MPGFFSCDIRRHLAPARDQCYAGPMRDVTTSNFGLLIAFVLPGFILLWGIAPYSTTISGWLGQTTRGGAKFGQLKSRTSARK
ncbi:MAG TPA: hypothetical protein PLR25_24075, partial [Planctomycetaceae bacterium]|nr:hypothetical protein [Planctomycetaceae bacterium]